MISFMFFIIVLSFGGGHFDLLIIAQNPANVPCKFVLMCATFPISDEKLCQVYQKNQLEIPALIMQGEKDPFTSKETLSKVANVLKNCTIVMHDRGHYVSTTSVVSAKVIEFINKFK